jgi:hypothetical protein
MRKKPNGLTSDGRITAHGVFTRLTLLNSRYVGMTSAVAGTMIVPRTIPSRALLPRNTYLANP